MDMDAEKLRAIRQKYFDSQTGSTGSRQKGDREPDMHLVFPSVPQGPRFTYQSVGDLVGKRVPWIPKSQEDLVRACISSLCQNKWAWSVNMSDLMSIFKEECFSSGVSMHLLPRYPFGLISDIKADAKSRVNEQGKDAKVKHAISFLTKVCGEKWMTIKTEPQYLDYFKAMPPLADPLKSSSLLSSTVLNLECDVPYHPECAGQHLMSQTLYESRVSRVVSSFASYSPVFITGRVGALDANIVMRLKCAAKEFNYDYSIKKSLSGPNATTFLRIPNTFCFKINQSLKLNGGRCSLNKLLGDLAREYLPDVDEATKYIAAGKMIAILKCMSSQNKEDLEVSKDTPWIFFYNENLSGDSLDFHQDNLGKHFWRSLQAMGDAYDRDFADVARYDEMRRFVKKVVVAFPHGCDLRDRHDPSFMCPIRFEHHAAESNHVLECHGITRHEQATVSKLSGGLFPNLKSCTPLYDWIESKKLKGVFDVSHLQKIEHLGDVIAEFVSIHSKNFQIVSQLKEMHENLVQLMEAMQSVVDDPEAAAKATELMAQSQLYARYIQVWEKTLLHPEDLQRYLVAWLEALNLQTSVMLKFNEMKSEWENAQGKAARMANILTRDWHNELSRAGCNLGSVSSLSYYQNLNDSQLHKGGQLPNLMLAMVSSLEENKAKSSSHVASAYKVCQDQSKIDPTSLGLPMELEQSVIRPSKRKRDDSDDDDLQLYKQLKLHESTNQLPATSKVDFRKLKDHLASQKELIRLDARHFDTQDIKQFLNPIKSVYPGEDVVHIGKGSTPGVSALELYDPRTIYVDVRDWKDVLFSILTILKFGLSENKGVSVVTISKSLVNALDTMFKLSVKGKSEMKVIVQERLVKVQQTDCCRIADMRSHSWRLFVELIEFLNTNYHQEMNDLFRVRFSKHGDPSGTVVQVLGDAYPERNRGTTLTIQELFETKQQRPSWDKKIYVVENHSKLFRDQEALTRFTKKKFMEEIHSMGKRKESNLSLLNIQSGIMPKGIESNFLHQGATVTDVSHRSMPLARVAVEEGMRCHDSRPVQMLASKDDLQAYDEEVNSFRKKHCLICLEPFSNRPLEGFNCLYRKTEREFKERNWISSEVIIREDSKMYRDYLKFVSSQISETCDARRDDVECNGMHLFHKSCIRRLIQLEALNLKSDAVQCPYCRESIYDKKDKMTVLSNMNEIACRLLLNMEDEYLAEKDDNEVVDLKRGKREHPIPEGISSEPLEMSGFKQYLMLDNGPSKGSPEKLNRDATEKYVEHLKDYIRLQQDSFAEPQCLMEACSKEANQEILSKVENTLVAGLNHCGAPLVLA